MYNLTLGKITQLTETTNMTKKKDKAARGGKMKAAKARAAKTKGGKGMVKNRPAGKKIMDS